MTAKKRASTPVAKPQVKRLRRFQNDQLRTQDLWKNLDRVRTTNDNADAVLKHSCLLIPVLTKSAIAEYLACIQALYVYIDSEKLKLHKIKSDYGFIALRNFSLLDCCLVLTVLLALKNKRWIAADSNDYFNIPNNVSLSGTFYIPAGSVGPNVVKSQHPVSFVSSRYCAVTGFEEFFIDAPIGLNLTPFMESLSLLITQTKFSSSTSALSRFRQQFRAIQETMTLDLHESSFSKKLLVDMSLVAKENVPLLETSKQNLRSYAQELILHNNQATSSETSTTRDGSHQSSAAPVADAVEGAKRARSRQQIVSPDRNSMPVERATGHPHSSSGATRFSPNSSFMTQQQIKEHCVATVQASIDVMKNKSPYQIFRLYVKCPRQHYIDVVYQSLNDLRSQTNCNIVVLNLNNLHESDSWFESLDVSPYTKSVQRPHPSTVRVISVGGVGEHMTKALDLIYKILSS